MFCVSVKVKTPPHWPGQRQAVKAFTSPNTSSLIRNDYDSNEDGLNWSYFLFFLLFRFSLFSDLRSLAGTTLLSLLASLFMGQLLFVIGVGGVQVSVSAADNAHKTTRARSTERKGVVINLSLVTFHPHVHAHDHKFGSHVPQPTHISRTLSCVCRCHWHCSSWSWPPSAGCAAAAITRSPCFATMQIWHHNRSRGWEKCWRTTGGY